MKLYRIKEGTKGKVVRTADNDVRDWVVRKDMNFMDTIIDPIRYHNRPADCDNTFYNKLAQQGYALFSKDGDPRYILAVQYEDVNVLC